MGKDSANGQTLTETFLWPRLEAPELWLPPATPMFSFMRSSLKVCFCPEEGSVSPSLAQSRSSPEKLAEADGGRQRSEEDQRRAGTIADKINCSVILLVVVFTLTEIQKKKNPR